MSHLLEFVEKLTNLTQTKNNNSGGKKKKHDLKLQNFHYPWHFLSNTLDKEWGILPALVSAQDGEKVLQHAKIGNLNIKLGGKSHASKQIFDYIKFIEA